MTASSATHVDRIITHMMELHRLLRRHSDTLGTQREHSALNWPQLHALMLIREHDGMTMKELAKSLHITAPSATSFVERLVKLRWVSRHADPKNRKLVRIKVTEIGKSALTDAMQQKKRLLRRVFGLMQAKDQNEFARILQELCSVLESTKSLPSS